MRDQFWRPISGRAGFEIATFTAGIGHLVTAIDVGNHLEFAGRLVLPVIALACQWDAS